MPSIFPDESNGGVIIRDAAGNCLNPGTVANAYCPPATFVTNCEITALPSNCDARLSPAQINAIASEMLRLAECMDPDGPWDCGRLDNLCSAFGIWQTNNKVVDGSSITGSGTPSDPWTAVVGGGGSFNNYIEAPAAPTTPTTGFHWKNTSTVPLNGISPGATAMWNGTAWVAQSFGTFEVGFKSFVPTAGVMATLPINDTTIPFKFGPDEIESIGPDFIVPRPGRYVISANFNLHVNIAGNPGNSNRAFSHVLVPELNAGSINSLVNQTSDFSIIGTAGINSTKCLNLTQAFVTVPAGGQVRFRYIFNFSPTADIVGADVLQASSWFTMRRVT